MARLKVRRTEELDRILQVFSSSQSGLKRYESPPWLKSRLLDVQWRVSNHYCGFQIDWAKLARHFQQKLEGSPPGIDWNALKYWISASTHSDALSASTEKSQAERLRASIVCIDYLLLNEARFGMVRHGLRSIHIEDYMSFLHDVSQSSAVHKNVYRWPEKIAEFFRAEMERSGSVPLIRNRSSVPRELLLPRSEECYSGLDQEESVFARVWLWNRAMYERGYGKDLYYYRPNIVALGELIYPEILTPHKKLPIPPELCFLPRESYERERSGAPVVSDDQRMSRPRLDRYGAAFASLRLLHGRLEDSPQIKEWPKPSTLPRTSDLKEIGRYALPTAEAVMKALGRALEFYLAHGSHIGKSYIRLVRMANKRGVSVSQLCGSTSIVSIIHPDTAAMGVIKWSLNSDRNDMAVDKQQYFRRLRSNEGLWELICVMMGAAQVVIGCLSARRVTELCELRVANCINEDQRRLIFQARKRMAFGVRQTMDKPLPDVAINVVKQLIAFQRAIAKIHSEAPGHVFDRVTRQGSRLTRPCTALCFNSSLDKFFDYIEMPCDEDGRRYYLRQHQLRRFFAIAFFWNHSFKGLDALCSFLGHSTAEDTYRYITEAVPGEVMNAVKAQWLTEHVTDEASAHRQLAELIYRRFGTRDFNMVETPEMEGFLRTLISSGGVEVEPVFIEGGRDFRIAVLVRGELR